MNYQQNHRISPQNNNCFANNKIFNREKSFRSTRNTRFSVDLSRKEQKNETDYQREYDFFKDDKMRVEDELKKKRNFTRPSINLFRRQKQSKWLELLANNKNTQDHSPKQSHPQNSQKMSPLRINIYSDNKKKTISYHRSTSQGFKIEQREISTALQKKRNYNIKQRSNTCVKLHQRQKHFQVKDEGKKRRSKNEQKQINFQVRAKPINEIVVTRSRKTRQQIKRMYSPSNFFRNSKKKEERIVEASGSDLFKAWELSSQQFFSNELESYTQDLFQNQNIQMQMFPLKINHRKIRSQKI